MSQAYSNPAREADKFALPDIEVFYADAGDFGGEFDPAGGEEVNEAGWYWWSCFPGCLPDSEPMGPFATEAEALADAQS